MTFLYDHDYNHRVASNKYAATAISRTSSSSRAFFATPGVESTHHQLVTHQRTVTQHQPNTTSVHHMGCGVRAHGTGTRTAARHSRHDEAHAVGAQGNDVVLVEERQTGNAQQVPLPHTIAKHEPAESIEQRRNRHKRALQQDSDHDR